jgi:hypothetical protein
MSSPRSISAHRRPWARRLALTIGVGVAVGAVLSVAGCADVSSSPDVPASIEMANFPFPSVVLGDTLRDVNGVPTPVRAVVRNSAGDTLSNTGTRYLYADYNRDSALFVDSTSGLVIARKATTSSEARIAARAGSALQVIAKLLVTVRPDSVSASRSTVQLTTQFPDTGRTKANANTTSALQVLVQNLQGSTPTGVNGWVVQFTLLRPANASNDTTQAAWLVNDNGTASVIDTTDGSGNAGRRVRVRADRFPTTGTDTVQVRATLTYKGKPVAGSGVIVSGVVKRGGT